MFATQIVPILLNLWLLPYCGIVVTRYVLLETIYPPTIQLGSVQYHRGAIIVIQYGGSAISVDTGVQQKIIPYIQHFVAILTMTPQKLITIVNIKNMVFLSDV